MLRLFHGPSAQIQMVAQDELVPLAGHDDDEVFIPECPELDGEVRRLHVMARDGLLATDAAERQINSYLFAAAFLRERGGCPSTLGARALVLPVGDAPHFGVLPDLGGILHGVLCRTPSCAVAVLIEQCIPCYRRVVPVKTKKRVCIPRYG